MDAHKCFIIFTDPAVGEFQHEIVGTVELPNLMGDFRPDKTLYVDVTSVTNIEIPFRNEFMMRGRRAVETFILEKNREKYMRGEKNVNL
jgi:hypothetical protein